MSDPHDPAADAPAGAPGTLALGGRLLVVGQPTDADFITLRQELRRQCLPQVRSPLAAIADDLKALPPEFRQAAIDAAVALKAGGNAGPTDDVVSNRLYHPDGCRFWVWWLARKHHPELTLADVEPLVTEATVPEALAGLLRASGLEAVGGNGTGRPG